MEKVNKAFFELEYGNQFGKGLKAGKRENIFRIIDAFESDPDMKSLRWLAYILATSMHESNDTFAPVVEGYWIKPESKRVASLYNYYAKNNPGALRTIFPNGKNGTAYYGRGRVVQLTHNFNYKLASEKVYGDDRLFKNPDLIIEDVNCDMSVTFKGMLQGWFTGRKLTQYFPLDSQKADWVNARKIINGLDKAKLIAGYAEKFYECLEWEG
ncbi:MAG: hypothetical protein K8I03_14560 [Ignavibacteria bacterium]|nr:hypothetical protein [Ignavibacteria bacterium]